MKFEEAIDIFDNCSKLMLVTTYKRLCRLNRTKMMEVTNDMKKNFTETSIYAKYYLTVNGKTMLYTEYGEIENNNFVLDTTSVEVDKDKKEIYSDSSEKVLLKKMFLGLGGGGIKKNKEIAYELWF